MQHDPCQAYLASLTSPKSIRVARASLNAFARCHGCESHETFCWSDLSAGHIAHFNQQQISEGKSPNTINMRLSLLKSVAQQARLLHIISADEHERIKAIKRIKGRREPAGRFIEDDEFRYIIRSIKAQAEAEKPNPAIRRDLAILAVARYGGLRRTELALLDLEDCNWGDMSLRIKGKGNNRRDQALPEFVIDIISDWIDVRGEHHGPLFTRIRRHGIVTPDRLTDQGIYYIVTTMQERAGLEAVKPHDIRRTYCTSLLDEGNDLSVVSDLMGHADIRTTKIYDRRDATTRSRVARSQKNIFN